MPKQNCPSGSLPLLLQDALSADESSQVLNHLETCTSCQRQLETLGAESAWWERASRGLSGVKLDGEGQLPPPPVNRSSSSVEVLIEGQPTDEDSGSLSSTNVTELLDPPMHSEMLGRIDEFDIEEKIGQGGMGVVFRGFDRSLNRPVAVKVMAPHLGSNGVARQRFAREAQAAAAVVHPHVVPIYRVNSSEERPYIAMALVDGQSLQDHVAKHGPLETKDVVRVSIQIADGLAAAHRHGLIHRDIKPANILMEKEVSRVLISDFGLARAVDDVAMTQSGCLAGTPHYMSPEQVTGEDLDHRSDLFSVGGVMYFLATGQEPFRAEGAFAVIQKIMAEVPVSPRQVLADVPETLSRIILQLLEKRPADRIQSADQLQQLLTEYLAHLQNPQHHAQPRVRATRSQRRRVLQRASWGLALAGCAGLLWWTSQSGGGAPHGVADHGQADRHGARHGDDHAGEHHAELDPAHHPSHH